MLDGSILLYMPIVVAFVVSYPPLYLVNRLFNSRNDFGACRPLKALLFGFLLWLLGVVIPLRINEESEHPWFSGESNFGVGLMVCSSLIGFLASGLTSAAYAVRKEVPEPAGETPEVEGSSAKKRVLIICISLVCIAIVLLGIFSLFNN